MKRVAGDTSAPGDYFRPNRISPPAVLKTEEVFLPLPVIGELYAGAFSSTRQDENIQAISDFIKISIVLLADADSARVYGQLRAAASAEITGSKRNDLWIAALCLQHNLPLLTND